MVEQQYRLKDIEWINRASVWSPDNEIDIYFPINSDLTYSIESVHGETKNFKITVRTFTPRTRDMQFRYHREDDLEEAKSWVLNDYKKFVERFVEAV